MKHPSAPRIGGDAASRALRTVKSALPLLLFPLLAAGCGAARPTKAPETPAPAAEPPPAASPESDRAAEMPASGAAAPEGAPAPSSTQGARQGAADELDAWDRKLESAVQLAAPDCAMAWSLRDRICDLAQRLCDVASRSDEPEIADRCSDGRARCERATARVRAACPD